MVRAERGEREILACQEGKQRAVSGGCRQAGGAGMEGRSGPSPVRDGDAGYLSSLLGNTTLRLAVAVGWVGGGLKIRRWKGPTADSSRTEDLGRN